MLTINIAATVAGIGLGSLCIAIGYTLGRAGMEDRLLDAQTDLAIVTDDLRISRARRWQVLEHAKDLGDELARVRRQNAALRERCGAPPELTPSDLENWT